MTDSPEHLADRPASQAEVIQTPKDLADPPEIENGALGLAAYPDHQDLLSDLLGGVRLLGERIVEYAPPPSFSIGFADIGTVHIIEQGELRLKIDSDERAERLQRGDVVLLPRGDAHHVTSTQHQARPGIDDRADGSRSATRTRATCWPVSRP
jgi:hypothetical protein